MSRIFCSNNLWRTIKGYLNADRALRYLPIAHAIKSVSMNENWKSSVTDPKILEIGSGVMGITPFIPFKIVGADIYFDGQISEKLYPICVKESQVPFRDKSFDCVISVDMLEHISQAKRYEAISEMLRVSRKWVFLAVPCDNAAQRQDRQFDQLFQKLTGTRNYFLKQHVEYDLPTKKEIEDYIYSASEAKNLKLSIRMQKNVNIRIRSLFMRIWVRSHLKFIYSLVSLMLFPLRRMLNYGECYRQIVEIVIQ
jgi:hypothetical protein